MKNSSPYPVWRGARTHSASRACEPPPKGEPFWKFVMVDQCICHGLKNGRRCMKAWCWSPGYKWFADIKMCFPIKYRTKCQAAWQEGARHLPEQWEAKEAAAMEIFLKLPPEKQTAPSTVFFPHTLQIPRLDTYKVHTVISFSAHMQCTHFATFVTLQFIKDLVLILSFQYPWIRLSGPGIGLQMTSSSFLVLQVHHWDAGEFS